MIIKKIKNNKIKMIRKRNSNVDKGNKPIIVVNMLISIGSKKRILSQKFWKNSYPACNFTSHKSKTWKA